MRVRTIRTVIASVAVAFGAMRGRACGHDRGGSRHRIGRRPRRALPGEEADDRRGENQYGERPQHLTFPMGRLVPNRGLPHEPTEA